MKSSRRSARMSQAPVFESLEARCLLTAYTVDSITDVSAADGMTTLREAIVLANGTPAEDDIIIFDAALNGQTITLTQGEIDIIDALVIQGLGAGNLTIDGGGSNRVFNVTDGNAGVFQTVVIEDVTIRNGSSAGDGGAILSAENLTLRNTVVTASSASRGAAVAGAGLLTVESSTLDGNNATNDGGAIFLQFANLTLTDSTISGNTAGTTGGGVSLVSSQLVVDGSAFVGNDAGSNGGGIFTSATDATITNATFSSNDADNDGGAIRFDAGTQLVANSTIAGNKADADGNAAGSGGGLSVSGTSTTRLLSTIVSGNTLDLGAAPNDVDGTLDGTSANNLIRNTATAGGLTDGSNGNLIGVDPLLGPLSNNGGPTLSYLPGSSSPVIDAGDNSEGSTFDQRGTPYARISGAGPDIGSIEVQMPEITGIMTDSPILRRGATFMLTGQGVTLNGGTVNSVAYYADANNNGMADAGEFLASATAATGYQVTLNTATTLGLTPGALTLLAIAQSGGFNSNPASVNVTVSAATPIITAFTGTGTEIEQGESFQVTAVIDGSNTVASKVGFYADLNGDGIADAGELLAEDTDGTDGFSLTLDGDDTAALPAANVRLLAVASDGLDNASSPSQAMFNVLYSLRAAEDTSVVSATTSNDVHIIGTINEAGDPIVFDQSGWSAVQLANTVSAPKALDDMVMWTDATNPALVHVAYPSADGLILLTRDAGGTWTLQNLSTIAGGTAPVGSLTQYIDINGNAVVAGVTGGGQLVAFVEGGGSWTFEDISQDLADRGSSTPALTELISYRPAWGTEHLAGIDGDGDIISVWKAPGAGETWRLSNLSDITGAAALSGGLSVILTSWGGINLTGLDNTGDLLVTWWVPSFGGTWKVTNLTASFAGPKLSSSALTGYYTSWDGMNYAGTNSDGQIVIYWWVPDFGGRWAISAITPPSMTDFPASSLTSLASNSGTLNILGATNNDEILRASWQPGDGAVWTVENLSDISTRT